MKQFKIETAAGIETVIGKTIYQAMTDYIIQNPGVDVLGINLVKG